MKMKKIILLLALLTVSSTMILYAAGFTETLAPPTIGPTDTATRVFPAGGSVNSAKIPTKGRVSPKIGVNVRTGPGKSYTKITAIPFGHDVEITEISGNWYKIIYGSVTGYSIASAITVTETRDEEIAEDDSVRKFMPTLFTVDPSTR